MLMPISQLDRYRTSQRSYTEPDNHRHVNVVWKFSLLDGKGRVCIAGSTVSRSTRDLSQTPAAVHCHFHAGKPLSYWGNVRCYWLNTQCELIPQAPFLRATLLAKCLSYTDFVRACGPTALAAPLCRNPQAAFRNRNWRPRRHALVPSFRMQRFAATRTTVHPQLPR
jgi:hypothetical protein